MKTWVVALSMAAGLIVTQAFAQASGAPPASDGNDRFAREDLDVDGRVTLAEARSAALSLFARFDADHDGQVTRDEARQRAHRWRLERGAERFSALDRDRDGSLSLTELGVPGRRFAALDRNADGRVTPAELGRDGGAPRCGGGEEASLRSLLWRRDLDRNGRVTRDEALRTAERRFARRDRNRDGVLTRDEARPLVR